jgi:toxin ParE1/3/4
MRQVLWSADARKDYLDILRYISADDPFAAEKVVNAIEKTGNMLADFATGRPGRAAGTYEKSVSRLPYVIVYALAGDGQTVSILRVIHSARDWPSDASPY